MTSHKRFRKQGSHSNTSLERSGNILKTLIFSSQLRRDIHDYQQCLFNVCTLCVCRSLGGGQSGAILPGLGREVGHLLFLRRRGDGVERRHAGEKRQEIQVRRLILHFLFILQLFPPYSCQNQDFVSILLKSQHVLRILQAQGMQHCDPYECTMFGGKSNSVTLRSLQDGQLVRLSEC